MLKLGIVGRGISYSLSPLIHKKAMRILGITGDYEIFDRDEAELEDFVRHCAKTEMRGLNITTPYKEIVMKICTEVSDTAAKTGAVNTLVFNSGTIRGENTDLFGFEKALRELVGARQLPCAIILGSGGVARAVLSVLSSWPTVQEILVVARQREAAQQKLASLTAGQYTDFYSFADPRLATTISRASLIVNCTMVGTTACPGLALPWVENLSASTAVMDLIYAPTKTELLAAAERVGCSWQNGLEMLLHQAAASFNIWTGKSFPLREVRAVLYKEVAAS